MLYFIIPLRSAQTTRNWQAIQRLLQNTVNSVDNQTCRDFKCLIVCHELPTEVELPDSCELLEASFEAPQVDPKAQITESIVFKMRTDKGRKLIFGLGKARIDPTAYAMFLDADDLVSNRLAQWVADYQGDNGWYFDGGYRWNQQTPNWLFSRRQFYKGCGSSYILRAALAPYPEQVDFEKDFDDYFIRRYVVHAYIRENMENLGYSLEPLPFAGAIYTFNGQNFFAANFRGRESHLRDVARMFVKGKRINQALRHEFRIPLASG